MNPETERKNRIISGISTAIICIGIFLIFWFYNFHYELPLINERGEVAVSLGEPDAGGPEEVPVEAESKPSVPTMSQPEAVEQTKDPDAVATKKSSDVVKPKTNATEKPKEQDNLLNDLLKGKKNQKATSAGDNDKTGPQGKPDGTPDESPKGGVSGTGVKLSPSLNGRTFRRGPGSSDCNQEGKVILDVTLMPDGRIRYDGPNPASTGSTCLENAAVKILKSSNFNSSENPVSVEGTITFIFTLK